ncbi:4Fe-4S dicluster domain-containing protein [Sorangium sp. So ce1000]|uniref:4Fe-4S dicluster domain-containing protein n=1 Tax=Sorangium sp. So ce1000 TaxID=3133325 RepID=UPI003F5E04F8
MAYVIAEPCIATCDTACVPVCPVDCIHGPLTADEIARIPEEERKTRLAGLQLYIDPGSCIGCGACENECPVGAIFDEDELPAEWQRYREINARFFDDRAEERAPAGT